MGSTDSDSSMETTENLSIDNNTDSNSSSEDEDGRPVQIIKLERINADEKTLKLTVQQQNFSKIVDLCGARNISVISIIGPTQTGKSFLLNYIKDKLHSLESDESSSLIKQNNGFPYRSDYYGVTKGIWMWSKPFIVEGEDGEMAVLLMDTEGINDELSTPEEILAITGISLLCSSTLIINSSGNLSRPTFDMLSSYIGKATKMQDLPKLSFAVRDWTNTFIQHYGKNGGKKLLANFISDYPARCQAVYKAFKNMEGFLLPHVGEKVQNPKFSGQTAELGKEFVKHVKAYVDNIASETELTARTMVGSEITGAEFKHFFLEFVNFFNNQANLEFGPDLEKLNELVRHTAGNIKINRGIKEYQKMFHLRKQASEYMHESMVDNLHIQAKRKGIEAFGQFPLRPEDEKYFLQIFEQKLKQLHETRKTENQSTKLVKTKESIEEACTRFSDEISQTFSYTNYEEPGIPANLIFYEEAEIEARIDATRELVTGQFLADFLDEDDDELDDLRQELNAALRPLEENLRAKNSENRERAEVNAENAIDNLFATYVEEMNKKISKLQNMAEDVLSVFHEGEIEKIDKKFSKVCLGEKQHTQRWKEELLDKIENELETIKLGLESTMSKALQLIKETTLEYESALKIVAENMNQEEILDFHQQYSCNILKQFVTKNPYPVTTPKHDEVESRLKRKLQEIFENIVEQGILVQRRQQEKLETARETSLANLAEQLDAALENGNFLDKEECRDFQRSSNIKTLHLFDTETLPIGADPLKVQQVRQQLQNEINTCLRNWDAANTVAQKVAEKEANDLVITCTQGYEAGMLEKVNAIQTHDELIQQHGLAKHAALQQFQQNFHTENSLLVGTSIEKLEIQLDEIFAEVEDVFKTFRKNIEVGLQAALFDAKTTYQTGMDTRLKNNKDGYFDDRALEKMGAEIRQKTIKTVCSEHKLNEEQKIALNLELDNLYTKYIQKNETTRKSYSGSDIAIGIDLGTTYCCVAAYHMGEVKIIRNALGQNITPSYVEIKADGNVVVGQTAKTNAYRNPEATVFDAKRMIGRRLDDKNLQQDMKFWPFVVEERNNQANIIVHGQHYLPEQISSMILKQLKSEAESQLGIKEIKKVVITVPAYFTDGQRQATLDAGYIAGLDVLGILNEPTAAAVAHRLEWNSVPKPRVVLIYDLGGGTFDVAILRISETKLDVLSINGDSHLGGEDFDQNLMRHCAAKFMAETKIDLLHGKDSVNKKERDDAKRRITRLTLNCEEAKKQLATAPVCTINAEEIFRGHDLNVDVTLKEFEAMNAKLFQNTIDIVDDAIRSAGIKKHEIDDIVLVGGSTRIRKIQELLQTYFNGKTLSKGINPDEAVAYGAAVQAAMLNATPGSKVFDFGTIEEVTPMSLGIEVASGDFDIIIPKNTKIPVKKHEEYWTYKDGQTNANIRIFQGEEQVANRNKLLGDFLLQGIPPAPKRQECVDVTMNIDNNGILSVEAVCRSTKGSKSMTVSEEKGRLSKEQKRLLRDQATSTTKTERERKNQQKLKPIFLASKFFE